MLQDVDLNKPTYLDPYKHFHNHPFERVFDPVDPIKLLEQATDRLPILRSTIFDFDTKLQTGGILNMPFIANTANATEMRSIFWIHELSDLDASGLPIMIMQYLQVVMLEFFPRRDGLPGLIKWPHVSINTMARATTKPITLAAMLNENIDPLTPAASLV